jgi:hypothetical protein
MAAVIGFVATAVFPRIREPARRRALQRIGSG